MEEKIRVFISYRHAGSDIYPKFLQTSLSAKGFSVFLDTSSMHTGTFDTQIYTEIDRSTAVLLLLPPGALDRCVNDGDWVRQEIAYSLQNGKCIIPLMMEGFAGFPEDLPEDIAAVQFYNGKPLNPANWDEVMGWLDMEIRSAAQKRSVTVMCPHCGRETVQTWKHDRQTVWCEDCRQPFSLREGADVYYQRGMIIRGSTIVKYVGKAKKLTLPSKELPFSNVLDTIGEDAFAGNSTLEEIDLSGSEQEVICSKPDGEEYAVYETVGICSIGSRAFAGCTRLQRVTLPWELNEHGIGVQAFADCRQLRSVDWQTDQPWITEMPAGTFSGCVSLREVYVPECLADIGSHAFCSCESLQQLHYVTYDSQSRRYVTCSGLPPAVRKIGDAAFQDCASLALPPLPEHVKIGEHAFRHTRYLPLEPDFDGETDAQGMVYTSQDDYYAELDDADDLITARRIVLRTVTDRGIRKLTVPEGVTEIGDFAFYGCTQLKEVSLPESLRVIGQKAFAKCTALVHIRLPEKLSLEKDAFFGCTALELPEGFSELYEYARKHSIPRLDYPDYLRAYFRGAKFTEDFADGGGEEKF